MPNETTSPNQAMERTPKAFGVARLVSREMKTLSLLLSIIVAATAQAESLRLILVPQQLAVPRQSSPTKFDLFLYNAGSAAQTVPSLEQFRASYNVRYHARSDSKSRTDIRVFSHPIKDHTLKAQGVDHTVIEIDFSPEDGDYVELRVEVGHGKRALTSNPVLLLCSPPNAAAAGPVRGTQSSNHAMERTPNSESLRERRIRSRSSWASLDI